MPCPKFEYDSHPRADSLLKAAIMTFFRALKSANDAQKLEDAKETRTWHLNFFTALTPPGYEYYAGHYRGEDFPCLLHYNIEIPSDPMVGCQSFIVPLCMSRVADQLQRAAAALDLEMHRYNNPRTSREFIVKTIQVVAYFFVVFLTIHPYANGNGHMARLVSVLLLDRYGIRAPSFTIHPRPQDPPYSDAIYRYRRNDTKPLETLFLRSLV